MNKTKIEWCDFTWNPITGCTNNCFYCYASRIYKRFKRSFAPTFHPEKIFEPEKLKTKSIIFCGSTTDLYDPMVKAIWREEVYKTIKDNDNHIFIVLTKQPHNIPDGEERPSNLWIGLTITNQADWNEKSEIYKRKIKVRRLLNFEPLLEEVYIPYMFADWVIIGGLTKSNRKTDVNWVIRLTERIKDISDVPIYIKDNIGKHIQFRTTDFPKEWMIE